MNENNIELEKIEKDEISFIDLFVMLWTRKWIVIGVTFIAMIGVFLYSVISLKLPPEKTYMPNLYTPAAHMLIKDKSNSSSSMLNSSSLGSLAGLVGINVQQNSTNSALAEYLVFSNSFLDAIVDEFKLLETHHYEKSPRFYSREMLKKRLRAYYDKATGVFTVSYTDKDPNFACDVINYVVDSLEKRFLEMGVDQNKLTKINLEENIRNSYGEILILQQQIQELEMSVSNGLSSNGIPSIIMDTSLLKMELTVQEQIYTGLKTQYESLKVTMASEQPVFQIIEYAEVPDRKSAPSRGKICMIVTILAFVLSIISIFIFEGIRSFAKNPVLKEKLKERRK